MNTEGLNIAAKSLDLTAAQMEQQADTARRLLGMAILGVPVMPLHHKVGERVLSLHALATAFSAIASTHPEITATAARLALGMSANLMALHDGHTAAQAVRSAAAQATPTNQPEGATHD